MSLLHEHFEKCRVFVRLPHQFVIVFGQFLLFHFHPVFRDLRRLIPLLLLVLRDASCGVHRGQAIPSDFLCLFGRVTVLFGDVQSLLRFLDVAGNVEFDAVSGSFLLGHLLRCPFARLA